MPTTCMTCSCSTRGDRCWRARDRGSARPHCEAMPRCDGSHGVAVARAPGANRYDTGRTRPGVPKSHSKAVRSHLPLVAAASYVAVRNPSKAPCGSADSHTLS